MAQIAQFGNMIQHTVLGLDPGFINCGYTVIDIRGDGERVQWRARATGLIQNPIQDFGNLATEILRFEAEISDMVDEYNISLMGIERFVGRQFTPKGRNPEAISFMVGCAASVGARRRVPTKLITAVQWKNAWDRVPKGQTAVRSPTKELYRACKAPPHLVDGCLQARYVGSIAVGCKPFEHETNVGAERMIRRIERLCDPALLVNRRHDGHLVL